MLKKIFDKKNRIFFVLIFVLILLLVLKTFFQKKNDSGIIITPTITPAPSVIEPEQEAGIGTPDFYEKVRPEILSNYPLFDYIPYENENFALDYTDPLSLEVILKKDTPTVRQQVLDWISSKKVDPATHTIIWKSP